MGGPADDSPVAPSGPYKLTGIAQVATSLRVGKLLDRGWPDYKPPVPENETMKNYRASLAWQTEHEGLKVERFAPGRDDQIVLLRDPRKYPGFELRNIGANGEVWTGVGTITRQQFPDLNTVPRADWPHENMLSTSFRLSYGKFDYFNGGDIPGVSPEGMPVWHDVETPVAKAVGPVDAAILDHHGYVDSQNAFLIGALRPRVWLISVWGSGHPTIAVWQRLHSTRIYPGPRDIFATDLHDATRLVVGGIEKLASDHGHIVLRVGPSGEQYSVVIVDDSSESHRVTKVCGGRTARGSVARSGPAGPPTNRETNHSRLTCPSERETRSASRSLAGRRDRIPPRHRLNRPKICGAAGPVFSMLPGRTAHRICDREAVLLGVRNRLSLRTERPGA